MKSFNAILTTLLAIPAAASPAALQPIVAARATAASVTGTSTFYGGNLSGGTCSFSTYTLPKGIYGTAFSGSAWNLAAQCGACLEVTANGKSIIAMVVDKCPECNAGHLDLFSNAFKTLSPTSSDPLKTSYRPVTCPIASTSPLTLRVKSGASAYWFSMQVINANRPVAALHVSTDGGSTWKTTVRRDYNFFEQPAGFGTGAVAIRVTSNDGKTVIVKNVKVASDAQVVAGSNFK